MLTESFVKYLVEFYRKYHKPKPSRKELIAFTSFLMDHQIITETVIRQFTIIREYNTLSEKNLYKNKTQRIKSISGKYGFHENTIWNILKDQEGRFENNH